MLTRLERATRTNRAVADGPAYLRAVRDSGVRRACLTGCVGGRMPSATTFVITCPRRPTGPPMRHMYVRGTLEYGTLLRSELAQPRMARVRAACCMPRVREACCTPRAAIRHAPLSSGMAVTAPRHERVH